MRHLTHGADLAICDGWDGHASIINQLVLATKHLLLRCDCNGASSAFFLFEMELLWIGGGVEWNDFSFSRFCFRRYDCDSYSLFKANQRNYKSWPSCGSLSVEPSREADTLWDGWMCDDDDDKLDFSRGNFDQVPACLPNFLSSAAAEHTQDLLLSSNERA